MNITTKFASREEWVAGRRSSIGASESPILFGLGFASQSLFSLWASKVHGAKEETDSKLIRRGRLMEPGFLAVMQDEIPDSKCVACDQNKVYYRDGCEFISATPDAFVHRGQDLFLGEFKRVMFNRDAWSDGVPLRVQVQVQQQMACIPDVKGVYVLPLMGGYDGDPILVERDDDFIVGTLIPTVQKFWDRYVIPEVAPPLDGSAITSRILAKVHPNDSGEVIQLEEELSVLFNDHDDLSSQKKVVDEKLAYISNELKLRLGDASYAVLPDGRCVSWKTQDRKEFTVKASSSRVMRFAKKLPKNVI
jgi:predicted phage-related endonuclease